MSETQTDQNSGPDGAAAPTVLYETVAGSGSGGQVARITLNRPDRANAQNYQMLYELNAAFDRAVADDAVRVIVLAANGRHFSSGHDLSGGSDFSLSENAIGHWGGFKQPGMEGHWAREEEVYFGLCWRWRNIPKVLIAEVQGKVIAGGLMLVWPCDLVVAAEDATFSDPVVAFGANGVEYFGHPWELGVRKAKEMLFTGRAITARVAKEMGMVNRIVPEDRLTEETRRLPCSQ
jgi:enoyl-CoA hydratase